MKLILELKGFFLSKEGQLLTEITGGDATRARKESDEEEFSENENRGAEFMFCPLKERV